jgi:uncharacterized membrane protein
MKTQLEQSPFNDMQKDPNNYKWGIIYFNRKDSRIFLPKRNKWMGWTMNFANPYSYLIILAIIGLAIFI